LLIFNDKAEESGGICCPTFTTLEKETVAEVYELVFKEAQCGCTA